jgi:hypothetical protein
MEQLARLLKMPKWESLRAPPYQIPVVGMQGMYHASVNAFRVSTKLIRSPPAGRPKIAFGCGPRPSLCLVIHPAFPSVTARVHVRKKTPCVKKMAKGSHQRNHRSLSGGAHAPSGKIGRPENFSRPYPWLLNLIGEGSFSPSKT